MTDLGKFLIIAGVGLAIVGAAIFLLGKSGFRGLPGDVAYRGEHVSFYFPVVTCIVLSVLLTAGMWLWRWITRR
jgi:hypothetical protein